MYTLRQTNKKLLNKKHGPSESISYLIFSAPGFWKPFLKTPPETLKARPNSMCPKESKKLAQWLPRGAQLCVHFVLRGSLLAHTSIKIKKRRQLKNNTICYVRSLQIWPRIGLYSDWPTLHLKKLQRPRPKGTKNTIKSIFIVITNWTHLNWRFEPETIKTNKNNA